MTPEQERKFRFRLRLERERAAAPAKNAPVQAEADTPQEQRPDWALTDILTALPEAGMALGSGMAGASASGLMGIATGGDEQAMQDVQEGTTYKPQSRGGQVLTEAVQWPFQKWAEFADVVGKKDTDIASTAVPAPLAAAYGTLGNTLIQAIPMALGARAKAPGLKSGGALDNLMTTIKARLGNGEALDKSVKRAITELDPESVTSIRAALEANPEMSVADAIAAANMKGGPMFGENVVRLQQELSSDPKAGAPIRRREVAEQEAMTGSMERLAGGRTTAEQQAAQAAAAAERDRVTGPLRERALDRANIAGVVAPEIQAGIQSLDASQTAALRGEGQMRTAAAVDERLAATPPIREVPQAGAGPGGAKVFVPGREPRAGSKVETQYAKDARATADEFAAAAAEKHADIGLLRDQLEKMERNGLKPLTADSVLSSIKRQMSSVGSNSRDLVQHALKYAQDRIARVTNKDGTIDARNLYEARKDINEEIRSFLDSRPASSKQVAAGADTQIKAKIDAAIEGAGGIGWKNYLSTYAKMSEKIDRLKVAQLLTEKLKSESGKLSPTQFLNSLGRGESAVLKKSTGVPRYEELSQLFPEVDMATIRKVAEQLAIKEKGRQMGGTVSGATPGNISGAPSNIPHHLNPKVTIANYGLRGLLGSANPRIAAHTGQALSRSATLAKILEKGVDTTLQVAPDVQMRRAALIAALQNQQGE